MHKRCNRQSVKTRNSALAADPSHYHADRIGRSASEI